MKYQEQKAREEAENPKLKGKWEAKDKKYQLAPIAKRVELVEKERELQKFDRFDEEFVDSYNAEH